MSVTLCDCVFFFFKYHILGPVTTIRYVAKFIQLHLRCPQATNSCRLATLCVSTLELLMLCSCLWCVTTHPSLPVYLIASTITAHLFSVPLTTPADPPYIPALSAGSFSRSSNVPLNLGVRCLLSLLPPRPLTVVCSCRLTLC